MIMVFLTEAIGSICGLKKLLCSVLLGLFLAFGQKYLLIFQTLKIIKCLLRNFQKYSILENTHTEFLFYNQQIQK